MNAYRLFPAWCAALALTALLGAGCDRTPVIDTQQQAAPSYKENIINANKVIASSEETQIDSYLSRRQWHMTRLGDGVRYEEYQAGKGATLDYEDHVALSYRLEALNGDILYSRVSDTLTLGHHLPNEGLDNALRHLRRGSKARVIVPSSIGFGAAGDGDRVPARTVLVYDLQID